MSAKLWDIEQRAPPIFGRAAITFGIGPHSSLFTIIRPQQYYICGFGLLLQTKERGLSVCLSITVVSPAKVAEPIEMPFGLWAGMGRRNHVLDGYPDTP